MTSSTITILGIECQIARRNGSTAEPVPFENRTNGVYLGLPHNCPYQISMTNRESTNVDVSIDVDEKSVACVRIIPGDTQTVSTWWNGDESTRHRQLVFYREGSTEAVASGCVAGSKENGLLSFEVHREKFVFHGGTKLGESEVAIRPHFFESLTKGKGSKEGKESKEGAEFKAPAFMEESYDSLYIEEDAVRSIENKSPPAFVEESAKAPGSYLMGSTDPPREMSGYTGAGELRHTELINHECIVDGIKQKKYVQLYCKIGESSTGSTVPPRVD